MINTVIFDIGNVLAYFCWREVFEKFFSPEELEEAAKVSIYDLETWNHIDQGIKTFDEYMDIIGERAPHLKEKIREAIIAVFKAIEPFDYAENFVKDLKARGYNVYILSNYGEYPFSLSKERYTFLNYVDGGIISYQVKLIKPHKDIYEALFKKYNIDPSKAVFLDDNENNVLGARNAGLHAIHFTDYNKGKSELEELLKAE